MFQQSDQATGTLRCEILALLTDMQNADGGWPFHAGGQSRVEPTCWAIRAISDSQDLQSRALDFLKSRQRADGSWPATSEMESGSWVTSLACSILARAPGCRKSVSTGMLWLCEDYPRDSSPWQKFLKKFYNLSHIVAHNDSYRGWGWTPRTSSWVEPTAFALMAFQDREAGDSQHSAQIAERRDLALSLLYDRMCPGGGWNCGNPRVYGVDGDPLVLPTCWALLALRNAPEHPNRDLSLAWLRNAFPTIETAGSLAVARITLENYGIEPPAAKRNLSSWTGQEIAEQGSHVMAWVSLALNPARTWPGVACSQTQVAQ